MAGRKGRPTKYRPEFVQKVTPYAEAGATDAEIAELLGISRATLYEWKHAHREFSDALRLGKSAADERVEASLYHRAVGYTFDAVKIMAVAIGNNGGSEVRRIKYREHVPPDTNAAFQWLKNRKPTEWRDRQEIEHGVSEGFADMLVKARERARKR